MAKGAEEGVKRVLMRGVKRMLMMGVKRMLMMGVERMLMRGVRRSKENQKRGCAVVLILFLSWF